MFVAGLGMKRTKNKSIRAQLAQCTAKICAYMEVNKLDEARQWATILQQKLIEMNLLVDNARSHGHNGAQPENVTTTTGPNTK